MEIPLTRDRESAIARQINYVHIVCIAPSNPVALIFDIFFDRLEQKERHTQQQHPPTWRHFFKNKLQTVPTPLQSLFDPLARTFN